MRRSMFLFAVVAGLFALMATAPAQAGVYVGGSVGQSTVDISFSDLDDGSLTGSADDSDTSFRVFGGFKFLKFFAVEAAWQDFGEVGINATSDGTGMYPAGPVTARQTVDGISLSGVGKVPVGKNFSLFARVGYLKWDGEITLTDASGSTRLSDDDTDMQYAAGVQYNFPGPGSLRFEYEMTEVSSIDIDTISVGYAFKF